MKLEIADERVVVRGMKPEENWWGAYQFPLPMKDKNRILVSVHVEDDTIITTGNPTRWFCTEDGGESYREVSPDLAPECGLLLNNGDRIYFPVLGGTDVSDFREFPMDMLTPDYDFQKQARDDEMPAQDGVTAWWNGEVIRAYRFDRLPKALAKSEWEMLRIPCGESTPKKETVPVKWPYLTRVVFERGEKRMMKPINPRGVPRLAPNGDIYITAFSGEGHLNPENGQYSPYYSAELFCSEDNGKSFYLKAHMEYPADGRAYPYQSGGFSDSDIAFFDDGSMLWFLRSAWMGSTGLEWAPMYVARSKDGGKTWSKPEVFSQSGVLPRTCRLSCGVTLLCYARPGMYVAAFDNRNGQQIGAPCCLIEPMDRSALANDPIKDPTWHQWDGQCGNPEIIALNENSALLFYGDFYYPDEKGIKRKTILSRKITVTP